MAAGQQKTATSYRHADFRYFYEMPCCGVHVGVLDDAAEFDCCACGARCFQRDCRVTVVEESHVD